MELHELFNTARASVEREVIFMRDNYGDFYDDAALLRHINHIQNQQSYVAKAAQAADNGDYQTASALLEFMLSDDGYKPSMI